MGVVSIPSLFSVHLFSKWKLAAEFGGWHFLDKSLLCFVSCSDEHSEIAPQKILFFLIESHSVA